MVLTLLVRDEEDVVRENIDFHLAHGIDFIIATDNGSKDRTLSFLKQYQRHGKLRLIREPADNYAQSEWVTRMALMAAREHGADWVIHCDADEFWIVPGGHFGKYLRTIPDEIGVLSVRRLNFPPVPEEKGPFWGHMVVREAMSFNERGDVLPPKVCHRASETVCVSAGNHSVTGVGGSEAFCKEMEILHFPLRTYAQFERKIRVGAAALARNPDVPPDICWTWRKHYQEWQQSRLPESYSAKLLSPESRAEGLASGSLVVDPRLCRFFQARFAGPRTGRWEWFRRWWASVRSANDSQ